MIRRVYCFEHEGREVLGFDTGLDSRSFAQAKLGALVAEPGILVSPDGAAALWRSLGVVEAGESMVVWGPSFTGERLDLLVNGGASRDQALRAVAWWIQAWLNAGASAPPVMPCAALAAADGSLLFAPSDLALRCVQAEGGQARLEGKEWYVHPDLSGGEAAFFTAACMLYRIFSGAPPFPAIDGEVLRQDMREGNCLPIGLAAPGLDPGLASLIQGALSPGGKTGGPASASAALGGLLGILKPPGAVSADSFFRALSEEERRAAAKEKEQFLKKKNFAVKTRRFVTRNTAIILGCAAALLVVILSARSIIKGRADQPTTAGMNSEQVIQSYYGAFAELNHPLMEACVIKGAGKSDIDMVLNLFVISKVRQAYEPGSASSLVPAPEWKAAGMKPENASVFGVTDLEITGLSGSEDSDEIRFTARYTLWMPYRGNSETETVEEAGGPAQNIRYADELTLVRQKGNWRIAAINRREENNRVVQ
jgi:hypothetical protein